MMNLLEKQTFWTLSRKKNHVLGCYQILKKWLH